VTSSFDGYVQFGTEVMSALTRDRELLDDRPIFILRTANPIAPREKQVSSIQWKARPTSSSSKGYQLLTNNDDKVEAIFKQYGDTRAIT
jgi:hypothetical protein